MRRDFWKKNGLAVTGILCLLIAWQGRAMETVTGQESVVPEQQEARKVALTFDDGPSEYTMELSRGLKERGVQATFFLLGENMEDRREMVEQLVKDGHLIGNHSYHHVQLNKLSKEAAKGEIEKTNQLIREWTGEDPLYIRPPYGAWSQELENVVDMIPVFWNVDSLNTAGSVSCACANCRVTVCIEYRISFSALSSCTGGRHQKGYRLLRHWYMPGRFPRRSSISDSRS